MKKNAAMPNLSDISYGQALILAKSLSGMTNADIAEMMGKGTETIRRYFTDPTYNPPSYLVPQLCEVLGNYILIEWQCIHARGHFVPDLPEGSIKRLEICMAELTKEFSDVIREDGLARLDGEYNNDDLEKIEREIHEFLSKGHQVLNLVRKGKERR